MSVFAIRDYRLLFSAQLIALLGTGLATVALGLLAYDLAGRNAGAVLRTALTIKMVMYVVIAPLAAAYVDRLPRRMFLAALDVVRAAVVLALPFITEVWHIYVMRPGLARLEYWPVPLSATLCSPSRLDVGQRAASRDC